MKTTVTIKTLGCEFSHYSNPTAKSTPSGTVELNSEGVCVALMFHSVQTLDQMVEVLGKVREQMTAGDENN